MGASSSTNGDATAVHWTGPSSLIVEGVTFVLIDTLLGTESWGAVSRPASPDELFLCKPKGLVERYRSLFASHPRANVVELGILQGGSVAFNAIVGRPARLVACDISPHRVVELDELVRQHGLGDVVRLHFDLDQGDRDRLGAVVTDEFGDALLDLVIDDASHRYRPTVASFEVLFPRLRPGGCYIIEDWRSEQFEAEFILDVLGDPESASSGAFAQQIVRTLVDGDPAAVAQARAAWSNLMAREGSPARARAQRWFEVVTRPPRSPEAEILHQHLAAPRPDAPAKPATEVDHRTLSHLAAQLALAAASRTDLIEEVAFDPHWIVVRRGSGTIDADGFRFTDTWVDPTDVLRGDAGL
jgi:hypothetical protein